MSLPVAKFTTTTNILYPRLLGSSYKQCGFNSPIRNPQTYILTHFSSHLTGQFQKDAAQVVSWIRNGEAMLAASFSIPGALAEAEQLKREHDQFQVAVEKTHASAVQVKYRADALRAANHYDPHTIRYGASFFSNLQSVKYSS